MPTGSIRRINDTSAWPRLSTDSRRRRTVRARGRGGLHRIQSPNPCIWQLDPRPNVGEIAFVAFAYGTVFGIVVLARRFPAAAFPPVRSHGMPKKKRIGPRIIIPMALALFASGALLQISFLVFGRSTAMFAVASLLHYYLVTGMLVSMRVLARGSHVGPPNATHGVTNSGSP